MKIAGTRQLQRWPQGLALLPTGELLLQSLSLEGLWLDAFDADLRALWTRALGEEALGITVDHRGVPWVIDRAGASAISSRGDVELRREAPPQPGMEVCALTCANDDLVFAYQHPWRLQPMFLRTPPTPPRLVCLRSTGSSRWSTELMTQSVRFNVEASTQELHHSPLSPPQNWICGYIQAGVLTVSGNKLLAVYSDMPRSGIAIGYVVSLIDGTLRYVTNAGPIHEVAAHRGGFLIGYQGYGAFNTLFYDERGRVQGRWPSHGRYVTYGEDIRVIESGNANYAPARLARLRMEGSVERGDLADGLETSRPYVHDDGTLYFARDGCMVAARDLSIEGQVRIHQSTDDDKVRHWHLVGAGNRLFTTFTSSTKPTTPLEGFEDSSAYLVRLDL